MQGSSLMSSRYAPRTPAENLSLSRNERTKKDRQQAARLLGRLQWKAESLWASYIRAREIVLAAFNQSNGPGQTLRQFLADIDYKQAESMFKVDFFEWYTLLERFLMICLSTLGVSVSGAGPRNNVNGLRSDKNFEDAQGRPRASHQFHANLLEALDAPKNPLHPVFGQQEVRIQLGLAKDYRNRWKDADEVKPKKWLQADDDNERKPIKLDELELETMIRTILWGCQHTLSIVHQDLSSNMSAPNRPSDSQLNDPMDINDQPWEYMDDAMDLD